ncbi:MAG TPA: hypothetical protein VLW85_22005, partial [Myxococcales bacterium]|nr:hypothetical protein [Myxococcales bacterium]
MTGPLLDKATGNVPSSVVLRELEKLPALPQELPYLDDYAGEHRVLIDPAQQDEWCLTADGKVYRLDFSEFEPSIGALLRHWARWSLSWGSPATLAINFRGIVTTTRGLGTTVLHSFLELSPPQLRELWLTKILTQGFPSRQVSGLKSVLR